MSTSQYLSFFIDGNGSPPNATTFRLLFSLISLRSTSFDNEDMKEGVTAKMNEENTPTLQYANWALLYHFCKESRRKKGFSFHYEQFSSAPKSSKYLNDRRVKAYHV